MGRSASPKCNRPLHLLTHSLTHSKQTGSHSRRTGGLSSDKQCLCSRRRRRASVEGGEGAKVGALSTWSDVSTQTRPRDFVFMRSVHVTPTHSRQLLYCWGAGGSFFLALLYCTSLRSGSGSLGHRLVALHCVCARSFGPPRGRKAASASRFLLPVVSLQRSGDPSNPLHSFPSFHFLPHGTRRFPFSGLCCFVEESASGTLQREVV